MNSPHNDPIEKCPPPEVLQRLAEGTAAEEEETVVEKHLDACAECRERFDQILEAAGHVAELRSVAGRATEADLEAIHAAGVPTFPHAEVQGGKVVLPNGLRLGLPRDTRYVARLGDYDVIAVIGEGGMGIVLKAWHEQLGRTVALKVMSPKWLGDQVARQRFLQEARSAAGLKHPNIIIIYAVGETDDMPFIDMEYVQGKSLALVIAEERQLQPSRAAEIARQILAALEHAHVQGIMHRDVKPGNVLLEGAGGEAKLVDFGLACGVADAIRHTAEGMVVGTPWYMSPEHAAGTHGCDPRSDLFSVGVVLFEMLVGSLPFPGKDPFQVLERIRTEEPPDPCSLNPKLPRPLAEIVLRALARDVARRYQSAAEFGAAIDDYLTTAAGKVTEPLLISSGAKAIGPGRDETRCSACSEILVSKLSVAGHCEVCQAPLCKKCWTIKGVRRCSRHLQADKPAADSVEKPKAGRRKPEQAKSAAEPGHPKVDSPAEARPAGRAPLRAPQGKGPSPKEALDERIARARAQGRPAISAGEARVAEETFVRLVENSLQSLTEVRDPCRDAVVPVENWAKAGQRTNRLSGLQEKGGLTGGQRGPSTESPKGAGLFYDLRSRDWLGRLLAWVVIDVRNLAHLERFARDGYDDQPVSRMELESLLNETARTAADQEAWRMLILYSPTGWTDEARDYATGKGARPFRDRMASVVLFEQDSARFLFDPIDERLAPLKEAFAVDLDEASLEKARRFVDEHFEVHNSLSLEAMVSDLGISRKAGIRLFKVLAGEGGFDIHMLDEVGMVLSRKE